MFSVLSKPSCSLSVSNPCILDSIGSKRSVYCGSSGADAATLPEDISHSTGDLLLPTGSINLDQTNTPHKPETSAPRWPGPSILRRDTAPVRLQSDGTKVLAARALQTRIDSVEDRCDRNRRELQRLICKAAQPNSEPARAHEDSDGSVAEVSDLASELYRNTTLRNRQQQRTSMRLGGSASQPPLPNASKNKRSRQCRALDLEISGTPKFKMHCDNDTASCPKLVRLQNRWRRVRGR